MKRLLYLLLVVNLFQQFAIGQNAKIDSLLKLVKTEKEDTTKINHFNELCFEYRLIGEYDNCLQYGNEALILSEKIKFPKGIAASYGKIGLFYSDQGDYNKALEYYFKALKIFEGLDNKAQIAAIIGNIGIVYHNQGDLPKALEYYFKALKINEEIGNKKNTAANIGNIGAIYSTQGDYSKALEYHFKALKIKEEIGNKNGIANTLGNIGNDYSDQNNEPKALEYYFKALKIAEELGNKNVIANNLGNIGNIYKGQGDYTKALEYCFKALKINEELGDKNYIATNLANIGSSYMGQKKYDEAEKYLLKGLQLTKEIGVLDLTRKVEESISELYFEMGNFKKAYEHHKQYSIVKDSILNIEKYDDITRKEMNYEFEKKETAAKAEQDKQTAVAAAESKKQKIIIWSVVTGMLLVIVFAIFIFRSLRSSQKQKRIIEEQKQVVENQKQLVEEKHKEISDSINYAERIQRALLASKNLLDENLSNYFILFKPKDVVSGDFYWATKLNNNQFVIVTADSTGHGVPGAIMSILNIACLKEAVTKGITSPDLILDETRRLVIENLKNDGSLEGGKDGMDGSMLSFDFGTDLPGGLQSGKDVVLTCASANNPIWIIRGNKLIEIKADRMPIGKHDKDEIPFTLHTLNLEKGDVVYTLTDGFADQFGGASGKKFKYKQLQDLLLSISNESMEIQRQKLNDVFDDWKGNFEQVDDLCLIGIRV